MPKYTYSLFWIWLKLVSAVYDTLDNRTIAATRKEVITVEQRIKGPKTNNMNAFFSS